MKIVGLRGVIIAKMTLAVAALLGGMLYWGSEPSPVAHAEESDGAEEVQPEGLPAAEEAEAGEKVASNSYGAKGDALQSNSERFISLEDVPKIPEGKAGLSDYTKIRSQLELMRQEVEEKIVRLKLATEAYLDAKKVSEEQLKLIAEEKQLLDETLQKEKTVQKERIDQALTFVEKMEPKKAAPVFEQMDRDLVLQLFQRLKPKTVTKLLESMDPAKATEYMEYYTKIRSGREFELLRDLKMCEGADFVDNPQELKN